MVKTVDFCLNAFKEVTPEERQKVLDKVKAMNGTTSVDRKEDLERLTTAELEVLNNIRAKQMMRIEDTMNLNGFERDTIDGYAPNLKRGSLGLVRRDADEAVLEKLAAPVVDLLVQVKEEVVPKAEVKDPVVSVVEMPGQGDEEPQLVTAAVTAGA